MPLPLLLDTDLGSDVDDELALALLRGSPEVALHGVCTTYGDTVLRARIVLRMAELVGRSVDVAPGERRPASGKEVWWAGIEGAAYDVLEFEVPHDPLAALALLEPARFTVAPPVAVRVSDGTDGPEGAVHVIDGEGAVRIATAVDVDAARASLADRIAAGLSVL